MPKGPKFVPFVSQWRSVAASRTSLTRRSFTRGMGLLTPKPSVALSHGKIHALVDKFFPHSFMWQPCNSLRRLISKHISAHHPKKLVSSAAIALVADVSSEMPHIGTRLVGSLVVPKKSALFCWFDERFVKILMFKEHKLKLSLVSTLAPRSVRDVDLVRQCTPYKALCPWSCFLSSSAS